MPRVAKRAITKHLLGISQSTVIAAAGVAGDVHYLLKPVVAGQATTTTTGTVTGLRWNFAVWGYQTGGAGVAGPIQCNATVKWIIVVVREGRAAAVPALWFDDLKDLYQPEEDVLAFGIKTFAPCEPATSFGKPVHFLGATKTMRKLKSGDQLYLIWAVRKVGATSETFDLHGHIQVFQKA